MNIQTILFGWSVAVLLCPAVLTAQQGSGVNSVARPVRYVANNQEVIPAPHAPMIVSPSDQTVPVVTVPSSGVASCNGCNPGCHSRCAVHRCRGRGLGCRCLAVNQPCATPFGASTSQILETQISKGRLAQMVFYDLHFMYRDGQWRLSPAGYDHAVTVCELMGYLPAGVNVQVESSGNAQVDEQRKLVVFQQLQAQGCEIPLQQLLVGKPRRLGITGPEAVILYQERLGRVANPVLQGSSGGGLGGGSSFGSAFSGISSASGFSNSNTAR